MTPLNFNSRIETILQKYVSIIEAVTEFTDNTECQSCSKNLRSVLQKYNILKGDKT